MSTELLPALRPYRRWVTLDILARSTAVLGTATAVILLLAAWVPEGTPSAWLPPAVLGVGVLGVALSGVAMAWNWRRRRLAPEGLGQEVERSLPGLGDAVRGALSLAQGGDDSSAGLREAFLHHVSLALNAQANLVGYRRTLAVRSRPFRVLMALAMVLAAGVVLLRGEAARRGLQRGWDWCRRAPKLFRRCGQMW